MLQLCVKNSANYKTALKGKDLLSEGNHIKVVLSQKYLKTLQNLQKPIYHGMEIVQRESEFNSPVPLEIPRLPVVAQQLFSMNQTQALSTTKYRPTIHCKFYYVSKIIFLLVCVF